MTPDFALSPETLALRQMLAALPVGAQSTYGELAKRLGFDPRWRGRLTAALTWARGEGIAIQTVRGIGIIRLEAAAGATHHIDTARRKIHRTAKRGVDAAKAALHGSNTPVDRRTLAGINALGLIAQLTQARTHTALTDDLAAGHKPGEAITRAIRDGG